MSELYKNEFYGEIGDVAIALRELSIPSKGQKRGFYLRTYKQAYEILHPILGDMLRWDASVNGRETMRQTLAQHLQFLQREVSGIRNKMVSKKTLVKINNERVRKARASVSVELTFSYIKGAPEDIHELKQYFYEFRSYHKIRTMRELPDIYSATIKYKKLIFNSVANGINKDIAKVIEKFSNSLGGAQYVIIFNVEHQKSRTIAVFNALTVPLRASGASTLQLFNKDGELMVDNIDEGSGTCVIDFIFNNYVKKYSRKYGGNGKFPYMTKDQIADDITSGWINTNRQSPTPLLKDCAPINFEEYDAKTDGVCILQLEEFCYTNKITLQCLDTEFNIFHTKVYKNASRESMMVIISDGHIYNIKDKTLRKTVQNSGRGAVHMAILENKEKPVHELTDNTTRTELNYEDISDIEERNIFITGEKDLEDLYIQLWAKENSKYAYKNNSNLMTQILLKDKTIFYNPDYEAVLDICKNLKINFDNQSLISVGKDLYKKVNPDFQLSNFYSYFNTETSQFFQSARRDNWVTSYKDGKEYDLNEVSSVDICKCYSSILGSDMDWMCFSSLDEVKGYEGARITTNAFYYITTNATVLFQGTGVYMGELVQIGLDDGIITSEDIKFYISTKKTTKGKFKPFVDYVFENCGDNAKYIINTFIGSSLGKTLKNVGKIRYTDNLNSASTAFFTQASPLKERGTGSKEGDEVMNVFIKGVSEDGTKKLYGIDNTRREALTDQTFILHVQIIQKTYIKVYNMCKANGINIAEDLIAVKTDNIIFKGEIKCELGADIGDYRKEEISRGELSKLKNNTHNKLEFSKTKTFQKMEKKFNDIEIEDEYNIDEIVEKTKDKDVLLMGRAGTGKSYVLRGIYQKLKDEGKNVVCSAFTHKAKKHLTDGMTLHKMFGFDINGKRSHKTNFNKVDVVIVDEVSMMSTMFYDALISLKKTNPKIRFILCGDFNQLQPVGEEHITFLNLRVIYDLCPNKLILKVNKRVQDNGQEFYELMEKALNGEEFTLPTTEAPLDLNLCYTNKTRKIINRKLMLKKRGHNFKTMVRNPEHIKLKTYGNSQTMYLYEGLPLLCKGGKGLDDLTNGDLLTVESYSDTEVVMTRTDDTVHTVKLNDLFIFTFFPAYCLTIHSAQGDTIDRPYAIYDMERFPSVNMTYTALSRSTKLSNIFRGSLINPNNF